MAKTLGQALAEVAELEQRAAVNDAIVNFLLTSYVGRDSLPAQKQLGCNGAPIPEGLIEEMSAEFAEAAVDMRKSAKLVLGGTHVSS